MARLRDPSGRENLAVLRHTALTLLKRDKKAKIGFKNKRVAAESDNAYLGELLMQSEALNSVETKTTLAIRDAFALSV